MSLALMGAERKTLFIDRMGGFESYLERAIQKEELGSIIDVVEEAQHPDFRTALTKRFASPYEAEIFKAKTGRNENTTLKLVDVANQKTLITYHFTSRQDEKMKQAAADEFIKQIKSC